MFRHIDPEEVDADCDVCGKPLRDYEVMETPSGAGLCPNCFRTDPT